MEQARREQRACKEWAHIGNYIRALEGDIWPRNRPQQRSRFVLNNLERIRGELLAQYTDTKPTITVQSSPNLDAQAEILTKQCIFTWIKESMDKRLEEVLDHALFSHAFWKVNGTNGRVSVIACGMDTVLPIHCAGDIQQASAIAYSTTKPLQYFQLKWGREVATKIYRTLGRNYGMNSSFGPAQKLSEYSWSKMSPQMQYAHRDMNPGYTALSVEAFPTAPLQEIWFEDVSINETKTNWIVRNPSLSLSDHNYWYVVKPGERFYPRKRLIIHGAEVPLYDSTGPYWFSGFPFAMLTLNPVVWAPGGLSKYRNLMPVNFGMNEIHAGIFDTVKKAINQVYMAKRNAVSPNDWNRFRPDVPGEKLIISSNASIGDVQPLAPPSLPGYVMDFAHTLLTQFDRAAGTVDTMDLMRKKQIPGGDTMEQIRGMQTGPIRREGRAIELFLGQAGQIAVSHYLQFYNREERYQILGDDGVTWDDYVWPANMIPATEAREAFWKNFHAIVVPGSLHGSNQDRDQTKAFTLFRAGALSTDTLLRKFNIVDPDKELQKIAAERSQGLGAAAVGRTPRITRGARNGAVA